MDLKIGIIIVAGGSGARAARHVADTPKQYRLLDGKPVLARTIDAFLDLERVAYVLPVIGDDHQTHYLNMGLQHAKLLDPVTGGKTRQQSCLRGLQALKELQPDLVMIHDGARPFVDADTLERICNALKTHKGALPVLPVTDTIKRSLDGHKIVATEDRSVLWAAQTPQGFVYDKILAAHRKAAHEPQDFTDDAAIAEWAGLDVVLVQGSAKTFKITAQEDFARAETLLKGNTPMETRVGSGMDIHQFEPGDMVRLGGIDIPHNAKLKGHSDADAALHVLTDALLGALAEGDIGRHFPPSDKKWKGEPSRTFLSYAAERVKHRGGRIVHLDLTIVCEAPKIAPVFEKIRQNIANICGITNSRVSVKATTSEQMGFVGRKEGLMTLGTATIEVPREEL